MQSTLSIWKICIGDMDLHRLLLCVYTGNSCYTNVSVNTFCYKYFISYQVQKILYLCIT